MTLIKLTDGRSINGDNVSEVKFQPDKNHETLLASVCSAAKKWTRGKILGAVPMGKLVLTWRVVELGTFLRY